MAYNKVEFNGSTIVDLTADTVDAAHLLSGYTAHDASGAAVTGTYSGSGGVLSTLTVTSNGTYTPSPGYDGFDEVDVSVSGGADTADAIIDRTVSGTYTNSTVTAIGPYAFYGCHFSEANFPNVSYISNNAFLTAYLSSISFPNAHYIGSYAFTYVRNLTQLTSDMFSDSLTLGESAFYNCYSLSSIDLPNVTSIGSYAFASCTSLRSVCMSNATSIGNYAFASCSSLYDVSFPNVTSIGTGAFRGCQWLMFPSFPNVTGIGDGAFSGCTYLISASFPAAATIGTSAFANCSQQLYSLDFPSALTVAPSAFAYCSVLSSLSLPLVSSIGVSIIYGCSALSSLDLPSLRLVPAAAFASTSLQYISVGNTSGVGLSAFQSCKSLAEVHLHGYSTYSRLGYISSYAFRYCSSLANLWLYCSAVPTLGASAFVNTPMLNSTYIGGWGSIHVPSSIYSSFLTATNWSAVKSRITSY